MRVLEVTTSLNQGGVDKIITEYVFRLDSSFDVEFMHCGSPGGMVEKEVLLRGFVVHRIPKMRKGLVKYLKSVKSIIRNGNFDAVHINTGYKGAFIAGIAKKLNVPLIICHSHFAFVPESFFAKISRRILASLCKLYSNCLMACGEDAAKWMWGKRCFLAKKVHILRNAIDANRYSFAPHIREEQRSLLNLQDEIVIGNVARLDPQKNHGFLIDVFSEFKKINTNSKLVLIGDGDSRADLEHKISLLGLSDSIIFLGVKKNVFELLNAMDVFVLPSRFEGLPIVLIEAQANGLPVITSDAVTKEAAILETTRFLPLSLGPKKWAEVIGESLDNHTRALPVQLNDYDIQTEAIKFGRFLKEKMEEIKSDERK